MFHRLKHTLNRVAPLLSRVALMALCGAALPTACAKQSASEEAPQATASAKAAPKQPPQVTPPPPEKPVFYSGAHILIGFKGAQRAKATRSKEAALKLAKEVAAEATKDPTKFADLARKHSEGPSGPRGGDLGTWQKGRMVPAFDQAIAKLKEGQISEPVETPFGYHVMIRRKVLPEITLSAAQLFIAFRGSPMANPKVKRSKKAAKTLAEKLAKQVQAAPDSFTTVVKKNSDGPRAKQGGTMRSWQTRSRAVPPVFTNAVRELKVGQISGVVESPFGFHVFKRTEAPPTFAGSHILVAYSGARRARPNVKRSKAQAKKLAAKLAKDLKAAPDKFVEMAAKNSDGPSAARGGSLGSWQKGQMVPEFDEAIEKMKVGDISPPVESPFGFHVIRRDDPEKTTK